MMLLRRLLGMYCLLSLLSACNTMEGFGKDVRTLGAKIEEKARRD